MRPLIKDIKGFNPIIIGYRSRKDHRNQNSYSSPLNYDPTELTKAIAAGMWVLAYLRRELVLKKNQNKICHKVQ